MAEILSINELANCDRAAVAAGTPSHILMERAGTAVADAIRARWSPRSVLVWVGPGNNGGDGYVVARLLRKHGWPVRVEALEQPRTQDARYMAARWKGDIQPLTGALAQAELYIDALFGAGLRWPLEGKSEALARAANAAGATIIAIDVPSGLAGDSGRPLGEHAFTATLTVTFHRRKIAHVLQPGRASCGEVVVADIDLKAGGSPYLLENLPGLWARSFPWPAISDHKHRRGRLAVIGGGALHTGAARMAARAGLRIGAGLCTVLSPPDAQGVYAVTLEAVTVQAFDTDAALIAAARDVDAVIIGPAAGVGGATVRNLLALGKTGAALIVDADALTSFCGDAKGLLSVLDRDDVLTPHVGEFERLFPGLLGSCPQRIQATREAARLTGAVVVLKGPDTVIAASDGRTVVNMNGSPWLATAGTGDVLCGFIGGLICQGMDSFEAACAAVWIHSESASGFGPGLIAEDLERLVPQVLARLYERRSPP